MSENLTKLFTDQFSTNLQLNLQQQGSKLRDLVTTGTHTGKMASPVQYVKPVKMKRTEGRFAPKKHTDTDFTRRWVFPIDFDLDQLIDSFDLVRTIVDPKSAYVTGASNAAGRQWDDEIITAFTATAYIGRDANGLSGETFDTTAYRIADTFGASAACGLTVAKIIELKRMYRHFEVDIEAEPVTLVIGSQQESDLLNQTQIVSKEFNDTPVLVNGSITRFLGFNIRVMERLPTYTTTTRGVMSFTKSGMYLGMWTDMTNDVDQRKDLTGHPWNLYTMMSCGATRLEPGRSIQVACKDAVGAAITP